MLQLIKPKYFMPVHGEYKMLRIHAESAIETGVPRENTFICANGDVLVMRDGEVFQAETRIQTDDIYVDGNDISGLSTAVLRDRKILADNGLVAVIVTIDSRTNKISLPAEHRFPRFRLHQRKSDTLEGSRNDRL